MKSVAFTSPPLSRAWITVTGALAGALALVWLSLYAIHPAIDQSFLFLAYVVAFNFLPGLVLARVFVPVDTTSGEFLLVAWTTGIVANVATVTALWILGLLWLLPVLPLGAAVALLTARNSHALPPPPGARGIAGWLTTTAFLCFTAILGPANVLAGDPLNSFSFHAAFQAVIARGLEQGWPPPNLMLANVPWSYNYAAHLWVLAAMKMTGLPIDALVARFAPVFLGGSAAAAMLVCGRRILNLRWWSAALAVIAVFWIVGIPPVAGKYFGTFMPFGATLLLSPFLALIVFFTALMFLVSAPDGTSPERFLILVMLFFLATGARGVVPPILICALLLLATMSWRTLRVTPWTQLSDVGAAVLGFVAGLAIFFTLGGGFSGTGFVKVTGQPFTFLTSAQQPQLPLPHMLKALGLPTILAGLGGFLMIALFQAGFLTPVVPAGVAAASERDKTALTLLAGSGLAGICAVFLTVAPGYSHFSFLYFTQVSFALIGARGLQAVLSGKDRLSQRLWIRSAVLTAVFGLLSLHLWQLRGPALDWIVDHVPHIALGLLRGSPVPTPRVASCWSDNDASLFAKAAAAPDASVLFVPANPNGTFACATFWLIANRPIPALHNFSLSRVPGRASDPALARLIETRVQHMGSAVQHAAEGHLSVPDVVALSRTLDPRSSVFVFAEAALIPDPPNVLIPIARDDRFALWKVPTETIR